MCMCTNTPAVDTRPKFFALPSFRHMYVKNFGLGTRQDVYKQYIKHLHKVMPKVVQVNGAASVY